MKINHEIKFNEEYIPPRCRKPRTRVASAVFTAEIPEVTSADAPVAFLIHNVKTGKDVVKEIRKYGDNLYELMKRPGDPEKINVTQPVKADELPRYIRHTTGTYVDKATAEDCCRREVSIYLIIDGVVWHTTTEPYYWVSETIGGDYVGFCVSTWPAPIDNGVYSAFQEDEARQAAAALAKQIGLPDCDKYTKQRNAWIEVVDPSAVKLHKGPVVFVIQKAVISEIAIKANSYDEALTLAQSLQPYGYPKKETTYSFHGVAKETDPHLITDDTLA